MSRIGLWSQVGVILTGHGSFNVLPALEMMIGPHRSSLKTTCHCKNTRLPLTLPSPSQYLVAYTHSFFDTGSIGSVQDEVYQLRFEFLGIAGISHA